MVVGKKKSGQPLQVYLDDADEASSPISITIIRELLFARVKLDLMSGQDGGYDASQRMQYCCNNPVKLNLHYGIPTCNCISNICISTGLKILFLH